MVSPQRVLGLSIAGWRNLAATELEPGPRFNVLAGDNGQGKSNLLEAIRYVSALESFRGAGTDELVATNGDRARVILRAQATPLPRELAVTLVKERARALSLDGKRPSSGLSWLAVLPTVLFHPGDLALAQGGPEGRRVLLDRVLTEMDPAYGATLGSYQKALRSRNRLLREETPDRRAVTSFDPILAEHGATLVRSRRALVGELAPGAERVFSEIVGEDVPVAIRYRPRVDGDASSIRTALERSLEKDLARGYTVEGPHSDDLVLEVRARGAKHHASQGQQRVLVLALRVAELEVLERRTGRTPLLLLDDVGSELDRDRTERFFALLSRLGSQVFLTTTRPELVAVEGERVDWRVHAGVVERP